MRWQIANEARRVELAITNLISNKREWIIVLLKTPPENRKLHQTKNKNAPKITHLLTIFVEHGIVAQKHDGYANEYSRIALSNDTVSNNF